jgi:hypothetical protein
MPDAVAAVKATAVPAKTTKEARSSQKTTTTPPPPAAAPVDPWQRIFNILGLLGFLFAILSMAPVKEAGQALIDNLALLKPSWPSQPAPVPVIVDDESMYEDHCPPHQYDSVKVVSRNPDIIIIEGFLSAWERQYLVDITYEPLSPPFFSFFFFPSRNSPIFVRGLTFWTEKIFLRTLGRLIIQVRMGPMNWTRPTVIRKALISPSQTRHPTNPSTASNNALRNCKATFRFTTWRIFKSSSTNNPP